MFTLLIATASAITNGTPADHLPEVVVLKVEREWTPHSGFLIHPQIVLTSGSRFDEVPPDRLPVGGDTQVMIGDSLDGAVVVANATRVVLHPDYVQSSFLNDLALVWLDRTIEGPVVALNERPLDDDWLGMPVEIAGFGSTARDEYEFHRIKRSGHTRVEGIDPWFVALFEPGGPDACWDDVGGPGLRYAGDLAVALSVSLHPGCDDSYSGQTRIDRHVPWIRDAIAPATLQTVALELPVLACEPPLPVGSAVERSCVVTVPDSDPVVEVTWNWGDGHVDAGPETRRTHTYDGPGAVRVCVTTEHRGRPFETCFDPVETYFAAEDAGPGCGCVHPGGRPWGLAILAVALTAWPVRRRRAARLV